MRFRKWKKGKKLGGNKNFFLLTTPETPSSLSPTRYARKALTNVMVISGIGALYMYRSQAVVAIPKTNPRATPPTARRTNWTSPEVTVVGSPSIAFPAARLEASTTKRRSTKKRTYAVPSLSRASRSTSVRSRLDRPASLRTATTATGSVAENMAPKSRHCPHVQS